MSAYPCGVCGWWHIGGAVAPQQAKRVAFIGAVFRVGADPGEYRRIVWSFDPVNNGLGRQLVGHEALLELRAELRNKLAAG